MCVSGSVCVSYAFSLVHLFLLICLICPIQICLLLLSYFLSFFRYLFQFNEEGLDLGGWGGEEGLEKAGRREL